MLYCDFLPRTILSLFPDDAVFGWWIGATDLNRCHWKVKWIYIVNTLENHKNLNDNLKKRYMSLCQRGLLVLASLPWTDGILSLVSWGTKQFGSRRKLCHDLWLRSSRKEAFLERFSLLTSSPYVLNMSAVLLMKCDKERIIARDILNSQMLLSLSYFPTICDVWYFWIGDGKDLSGR